MAVRYEKLKQLKIQNHFLVIKKKEINKNSNPSGYRFFFSRGEENSLSDDNRLIGFKDMKSLNHTYIHSRKKNYQNQPIYTHRQIHTTFNF